MKCKLVAFYLLLIAVYSCSKKDPIGKDEYVMLFYEQTQCSDPWQSGSTDSATLENVATYLNAQNLYIGNLSIKQTGPENICLACTCKTGKIIYVFTLNSSKLKSAYAGLGFSQ